MDELAVGDLDRLLRSAGIGRRVDCLNREDDWVVVISQGSEVIGAIESRVYGAHLGRELLFQAWRELVRIGARQGRVGIEARQL